MTIVFVEDNYASETDGTAISAHRFRDELIRLGHTVRVLAIGVTGTDMFALKEHYVPLVSEISRWNSMHFARFDKKVVTEAFTGADIVHLFFPWQMESKCVRLAAKMGIPVCGAFHCQPENVTYNMGFRYFTPTAHFIYFFFRRKLYRKLDMIHCPSAFIAGELKKHNYKARLYVISNGVSEFFKPPEAPVQKDGNTINILMVGRLAEEKRQDLIIKAVKYSKYRDRIQLYFAGKGPMKNRYMHQARGLPNPPKFEFLDRDRLRELIYKTDIYVHASDAEAEGMSCIESIACGKVPIISKSEKSATSQFALDERSLFRKGDYMELRDKIDWWIEHPAEREKMEGEYAALGKTYNINNSARRIEQMFKDAIANHKTKEMLKTDKDAARYYKKIRCNLTPGYVLCWLLYHIIAMPLLGCVNIIYFGLKVKNKEVLQKVKGSGVITICNHITFLDCAICGTNILPRKPLFVSQPSNFSIPVAGLLIKIFGAIPTPSSVRETHIFFHTLANYLRNGALIHIYPEGERREYGDEIQEFQRGTFYLAVEAQAPVLPMRLLYREPDGFLKYFKKKRPCLTLVFGEPVYPNNALGKKEAVSDMQERAWLAMNRLGDQTG
ncbi:hypothetical protein FACS189491_05340 [Spirochaetia bacterium]|nr:hypothetical protein FACS189491_05340 [Spirochaetia bacterium]